MTIDEFCRVHSGHARAIDNVVQDWSLADIRDLLHDACKSPQPAAAQATVGVAAIAGDALLGGSLLDQIPDAVQDAFVNLMKEEANSVSEMLAILESRLTAADGGFCSFNDRSVMGFVSKLKGQIGENLFKSHIGTAASLAKSGSQEGWDVAVQQADGAFEYVQVKLWGSASGVVGHMQDVQKKALNGGLTGINRESVSKVFFAVPDDIREDVMRLAQKHDVADMIYHTTVPISSEDASRLVQDAMASVGPEQLTHFFSELLKGAVAAGALHAAVNGFLMYKESKDFASAAADTITDTLVSTAGVGIAMLAERFIHSALMSSAVGISARFFIGHVTRSRWDFAEFLENSLTETESLMARLSRPETGVEALPCST
jgi:hypothetical protein